MPHARLILVAGVLSLALAAPAIAVQPKPEPAPAKVTPVPETLSKSLKLSPFYKKHLDVDGFPVLSSGKVADEALLEAAHLIRSMLKHRPDVIKALAKNKVRFAIMAPDEMTTDIPEHSDLKPKDYWDKRARGLGATKARPAVSCGEENLLNYSGDRYATENILVHEFGHAIHEMGLNSIDKEFDKQLMKIFTQSIDKGLWKKTYAATNRMEFWAEGVQSYFDTNRANDNQHNHVSTREKLKEYDPAFFALIDDAFRQNDWRYTRFDKRFPDKAKKLNAEYKQRKSAAAKAGN